MSGLSSGLPYAEIPIRRAMGTIVSIPDQERRKGLCRSPARRREHSRGVDREPELIRAGLDDKFQASRNNLGGCDDLPEL